jgi:hypothetical protein
MSQYDWADAFRRCYDKAVTAYRAGNRQPGKIFNSTESAFLAGIGCSVQEVYDFVEDGEPSFETVLLITAVRRGFFQMVQHGQLSAHVVSMAELPPKTAEVAGFPWLPRLIAKARAKLRGEMPLDLMYGCGGDRAFFKRANIHPADFLRVVWAAGEDDRKIIEYVKQCSGQAV